MGGSERTVETKPGCWCEKPLCSWRVQVLVSMYVRAATSPLHDVSRPMLRNLAADDGDDDVSAARDRESERERGKQRRTVLNHHGGDDAEERLVRGEDAVTAREGVALEPALERVLRQHLGDAAADVRRERVGLEAARRRVKDAVELVRRELVGREDAELLRVALDDVGHVLADRLHAAADVER